MTMDSLEDHERVLAISRLVDRWAEKNLTGTPNWRPLESVLPMEWCGGFMWMQRVEKKEATIELYKHGITRRYLNLDEHDHAYKLTNVGYRRVSIEEAIDWVFENIEGMGWSRETVYDVDFVARRCEALREAGWTVITTGMPVTKTATLRDGEELSP